MIKIGSQAIQTMLLPLSPVQSFIFKTSFGSEEVTSKGPDRVPQRNHFILVHIEYQPPMTKCQAYIWLLGNAK